MPGSTVASDESLSAARLRELTGGRALSEHEWLRLLGKGVIAVQEAFERDGGDRALSWSEITRAHDALDMRLKAVQKHAPARPLPAAPVLELPPRGEVNEKTEMFFGMVSRFVAAKIACDETAERVLPRRLMDRHPNATFAVGGAAGAAAPPKVLLQTALDGRAERAHVSLDDVYDLSLIHISEPRDQRGSRMPSSA